MQEHDEKSVAFEGAQVLSESPRALLVYLDGRELWVPKSQIHADSDVYERGQYGRLVISKWIAAERGLWKEEGEK